ncbi:hypothetical protein XPA_001925 [Xanthoria parietina]
MAITRSHQRARASDPRTHHAPLKSHTSHATVSDPRQPSVAGKRKRNAGLTKELAALGLLPKPEKKLYDGPGERGTGMRVTNQGTECTICAETQTPREFPEIATLGLCNHASRICRTCIARHTESQLSGDGKWRRVQCLDCRAKQSKAQICKLVWKEDFKKLEAFAKAKSDQLHPRYRPCLSPSCNRGQVHRSRGSVVTCKHCGSRSCFRHRVPWHEDYTCDRYNRSHPDAKTTRTSEQTVKKLGKKCPGCAIYIEKDGGCNSMFCSRCHTYFNWGQVKHD